jgi:hypothetical protein
MTCSLLQTTDGVEIDTTQNPYLQIDCKYLQIDCKTTVSKRMESEDPEEATYASAWRWKPFCFAEAISAPPVDLHGVFLRGDFLLYVFDVVATD